MLTTWKTIDPQKRKTVIQFLQNYTEDLSQSRNLESPIHGISTTLDEYIDKSQQIILNLKNNPSLVNFGINIVLFSDAQLAKGTIVECIQKESEERKKRFEQIRQSESSDLNRRLRFLLVLASSAPLIGLLGTVAGMLRTFAGLSMEESYKMDLVASGISQALVTTQAGLLIAIPALAFLHLLNRRKKDWLRCLNRMESISMRQISPSPLTAS